MNVSEGRDAGVLAALADAAGDDLLDVHTDPDHHRSVLTLVGEQAPRAVATRAIERIDLRRHEGVHPRFGAVDVVPFVPLRDATLADALSTALMVLGLQDGLAVVRATPGVEALLVDDTGGVHATPRLAAHVTLLHAPERSP